MKPSKHIKKQTKMARFMLKVHHLLFCTHTLRMNLSGFITISLYNCEPILLYVVLVNFFSEYFFWCPFTIGFQGMGINSF